MCKCQRVYKLTDEHAKFFSASLAAVTILQSGIIHVMIIHVMMEFVTKILENMMLMLCFVSSTFSTKVYFLPHKTSFLNLKHLNFE